MALLAAMDSKRCSLLVAVTVSLVAMSSTTSYAALFGYVVFWFFVTRVFLWLLKPLYQYLTQPKLVWQPSPTNWAVVTGGTDGIGLAYCRQLAQKGYPLLIISRSRDKLENVKSEIEKSIPQCPEVRTLSFDFSLNSESHYDEVQRAIEALAPGRVDVLVNNVGVSFATADYFTVISNNSPQLLAQMIHVNVVSAVKMTKMVWDRMLEDNRGVVLNVGSQSALNPIPLLALYSATKAYVDYFTHTLVLEAQNHSGVIVQSVLPGFVSTKMSHLRPSFKVPSADTFVRSQLARVGRSTRTYGYWWHSFIGLLYEMWDHVLGSDFNSWLAFTILSGYRDKYYRVKKIKDTYLNGDDDVGAACQQNGKKEN